MKSPQKHVSKGGQIRFSKPDKEWLESHYCLPPKGKGMKVAEIAEIAEGSTNLVVKWLKQFAIEEDSGDRMRFHTTGEYITFPKPDESELQSLYCLPPLGKGLSRSQMAIHYGVSKKVIRSWIESANFETYDRVTRSRFHSTGIVNEVTIPSRQELAKMYLLPPDGTGMSCDAIGEHYGVYRLTISKWIEDYGLTQDANERISFHNTGENNYSFSGGTSRNYHKNVLLRKNPDVVCEWCNYDDNVQIHHIDHDTNNGHPDNLMWLCYNCNLLEAHAYHLSKKGYADWQIVVKNGKRHLVVEFTKSDEDK